MAQKPRILILSTAYLPFIGGSELAIKNITDRLPDFDFDMVTGRLDGRLPEYEKIGNINVYRVGGRFGVAGFILPKAFLPLEIFQKARSLISKNDYILVHAYQASQAAGAGWLLKILKPKLPFLVTLQEGKNPDLQGKLMNFSRGLIIKKADQATAISQYLKNLITKYNPSIKISVIPNGVDMDLFSRQFSYGDLTALESKLGINADDFVIMSASRLVLKNGMDILIKAVAVLKNSSKGLKYKLLILGDGQEKNELKRIVKELLLQDEVIFVGTVNHENLPKYLAISDVFVRPSRSEGLGSAFLEAMAAGVPVIGTAVGGIPDFLKDKSTGLICKVDDPQDVAEKIATIMNDGELRDNIKEKAKKMIIQSYAWDIVAGQFRELYKKFASK